MPFSAKEMIRKRKSVRSYDGKGLRPEDKEALEQYIKTVENPFSVPVEFRLLDAKEHELTSPVVVGADMYIAAKVKRQKHFEMGYGYSFESVCLYAESLGIGTVILAASLSRPTFERAMEVQNGEIMPVATPVGYPAEKRTIRDSLIRKGLKADERIEFSNIFMKAHLIQG